MSDDKKAAAAPISEKRTKAQESGHALIREWQAAFRQAHGKEPPLVSFERGWFVFHTGQGPRYQRARMEGMLSRLKSRVAAARSPQTTAEPTT